MIDCAIRTSLSSVMPAGCEAQAGELLDERLEGYAVLQGDRDGDREGVHHSRKGRALLAEPQEDLPEPVVGIRTGGEIAFRATDPERRRDRRPGLREPLAYRRRGRCHDSHVRGL